MILNRRLRNYKMVKEGLTIEKYFSQPYGDVYADSNNVLKYTPREISITDDKGKIKEKIPNCIFPNWWSENAANTVATKYFRRKGVPVEGGRETDIRQLTKRVANTAAKWGVEQGYFNKENSEIFEQELAALTIGQYSAFNSPVWFNVGLDSYGIEQKRDGFYMKQNKVTPLENYYAHPQGSACFIISPEDSIEDMTNVGATISSRIFKGGSGIGGDWSKVRSSGEQISGGGVSSGTLKFTGIQDSTGAVIKSGGITRRAATNQSLAIWHPDTEEWIKYKYISETKARALIEAGSPSNWESHTIQDLKGQNANINIRTDNAFWKAYENNENYDLIRVTDKKIAKTVPARKLAKMLSFANHQCGDPNVQYHDTINLWNTCKNSGTIWATNPCSEFNWLNDSACNLASLNLLRFRLPDGTFDINSFLKAVDTNVTTQDIFVSEFSYPTPEVTLNSHTYRPLGLGYANLGAYIMSLGLAYDSDEARDFAAAITSMMTAEAYLQSTKLAEKLGPFQEYEKNKEPMLEVMEMHKKAAKKISKKNGLEKIIDTTNKIWEEVIARGKEYGYRNAQVTVLAPTGTIGFMMGCDTTGCEPEFQLKKYKELSGGASMIIVNETVPLALEKLNYNKDKIEKITNWVDKYGHVENCPEINKEDLPVFDCAITSGDGARAIEPIAHIKMLGAIQPHLSGAISKTVNCPTTTSVEEIGNMFYQAWKLGVKAVAIYRDGCKAAQPLSTKKDNKLVNILRGGIEPLPNPRPGITEKVKIGGVSYFIRTGEYNDGRLGEIFLDSLQRGTDVNRLINMLAMQFSKGLQLGLPLKEALEMLDKAGQSQIAGITNHPFIRMVSSQEEFLRKWLSAHYLGDISFVPKEPEMRPLPSELRIYQRVPKLHMLPTVEGEYMYPGVPSLEDTIKKISGDNFWCDSENGLDTRETVEKIKNTRVWGKENLNPQGIHGKITGKTCEICGSMMISDGSCSKCPKCKTSTGGCGGG